MAATHQAADRLAELIWRTVKLRVSLLALAIIALLVVRSALLNGDQQALDVDTKFCQQLVDEGNETVRPPYAPRSAEPWCTPAGVRSYIEGDRAANEMFSPALWGGVEPNDVFQKFSRRYKDKLKEFAEYDAKRRAAYRMQLQVSSEYSGSNIILDAISVAEVVPFCVLVVLAVVLLLGIQQTRYKAPLFPALKKEDGGNLAAAIARAQFFVRESPRTGSSLSRYFVLSPEGLATGALFIAVLVLFGAVLLAFIVNVVHLTDSIFFNYLFWLYGTAFVLAWLVIRTRKSYLEPVDRPPDLPREGNDLGQPTKWQRSSGIVLALLGFVCLALPWAQGLGTLRGYQFLLKQQAMHEFGQFVQYPLRPMVFREAQVQVYTALLFLLVCAADSVLRSRVAKRAARALHKIRTVAAIGILFFSLNLLVYMGILEYVSEAGTPWSVANMFSQGILEKAAGYTMDFYNPAYGFVIFLGCCLLLVWLSLRQGPVAR